MNNDIFKPKWKLKRENYELQKELELYRKLLNKQKLEEIHTVRVSYEDIDYLVSKGALRDDIARALKVGVPVRELLITIEDVDNYFLGDEEG